jgi:hypothetical protein
LLSRWLLLSLLGWIFLIFFIFLSSAVGPPQILILRSLFPSHLFPCSMLYVDTMQISTSSLDLSPKFSF